MILYMGKSYIYTLKRCWCKRNQTYIVRYMFYHVCNFQEDLHFNIFSQM